MEKINFKKQSKVIGKNNNLIEEASKIYNIQLG